MVSRLLSRFRRRVAPGRRSTHWEAEAASVAFGAVPARLSLDLRLRVCMARARMHRGVPWTLDQVREALLEHDVQVPLEALSSLSRTARSPTSTRLVLRLSAVFGVDRFYFVVDDEEAAYQERRLRRREEFGCLITGRW